MQSFVAFPVHHMPEPLVANFTLHRPRISVNHLMAFTARIIDKGLLTEPTLELQLILLVLQLMRFQIDHSSCRKSALVTAEILTRQLGVQQFNVIFERALISEGFVAQRTMGWNLRLFGLVFVTNVHRQKLLGGAPGVALVTEEIAGFFWQMAA